jgi:hypothetical protein
MIESLSIDYWSGTQISSKRETCCGTEVKVLQDNESVIVCSITFILQFLLYGYAPTLPVGIGGVLLPPTGKFLALRKTPLTALMSFFSTSIWSFFPSFAPGMP